MLMSPISIGFPSPCKEQAEHLQDVNLGPSLENMGLSPPVLEQSPSPFKRRDPEERSHIGFSRDPGYRSSAATDEGSLFHHGWLSQMTDCFVCYSLKPN